MRRPPMALALLAVLSLGALVWRYWNGTNSQPDAIAIERTVAPAPAAHTPVPATAVELPQRASSSAARARVHALDAGSNVPDAARAGDPAAQLELFRALNLCRLRYLYFFGGEKNRRTLDEGLDMAARQGSSVEEARLVHERCDSFMRGERPQLGTAEEWLQKAATAGNYEAQLLQAQRALRDAEIAVIGNESRNREASIELDRRRDEATRLLADGLVRRDPAAYWMIGDFQQRDKDTWVWFIAACKSGYDCSRDAEWFHVLCEFDYNCQPYESGIDVILRINASRYPDLEVLADELLQKIEAGEISDLRLRRGLAVDPQQH